jgi:SNF2 family DNA or RNA helicase
MITKLYPHQQNAVDKLKHVKVGALYMEQGTGKTRTALELIQRRWEAGKIDCVLWLCPCSTKENLKENIKFHAADEEFAKYIVVRGIESLSSSDRLYLQLLALIKIHRPYLVVDESTLVKNKRAIRTERIIEIGKKCEYKLILNGTPVSKNEADLFAQWYILDWRILGYQSYYSFAANHIEYYEIRLPDGSKIIDKRRIKNVLNVDYLTEKIAPYTYQVKKSECLELPKKNYCREAFSLTEEQRISYENVKYRYLIDIDEMRSDTIYKLFTACQHMTSGRLVTTSPTERMETRPLFPADENPRLLKLQEMIDDYIEDEKCIIFAKYQAEIDEICDLLKKMGKAYTVFTGKNPAEKKTGKPPGVC